MARIGMVAGAVQLKVRKWWLRLTAGGRYRARRRAAGMATERLSTFECYVRALDAFSLAIEGDAGASETELAIIRFLMPLNASELIEVATAMAMLGRPLYLDTHDRDQLEEMKLRLAWIWKPELER